MPPIKPDPHQSHQAPPRDPAPGDMLSNLRSARPPTPAPRWWWACPPTPKPAASWMPCSSETSSGLHRLRLGCSSSSPTTRGPSPETRRGAAASTQQATAEAVGGSQCGSRAPHKGGEEAPLPWAEAGNGGHPSSPPPAAPAAVTALVAVAVEAEEVVAEQSAAGTEDNDKARRRAESSSCRLKAWPPEGEGDNSAAQYRAARRRRPGAESVGLGAVSVGTEAMLVGPDAASVGERTASVVLGGALER